MHRQAFRPFADTLSTMSEDHMAMTRTCMHEACHSRYTSVSILCLVFVLLDCIYAICMFCILAWPRCLICVDSCAFRVVLLIICFVTRDFCVPRLFGGGESEIEYVHQENRSKMQDTTDMLAAMKAMVQKQDARIANLTRNQIFDMDEPDGDEVEGENDDGEWFSDDEDTEWITSQDQVSKIVDEFELPFGRENFLVNRDVFFWWCVSENGSLCSDRDSTMDYIELSKLLRAKRILPQLVSVTQVMTAFKEANTDHVASHSTNSDVHELDFPEFVDCMQRLHRAYVAFG